MLTSHEDIKFIQLLISSKSLNFKRFKVLYRSSINKYSAQKFHDLCDNHGPTITKLKINKEMH